MSVYTEARSKLHEPCKAEDSWQTAIEIAEEEIQKCERRISRLRNSIRLSRQMIRDGEPFDASTHSLEKKQ